MFGEEPDEKISGNPDATEAPPAKKSKPVKEVEGAPKCTEAWSDKRKALQETKTPLAVDAGPVSKLQLGLASPGTVTDLSAPSGAASSAAPLSAAVLPSVVPSERLMSRFRTLGSRLRTAPQPDEDAG